MNRLKELRKEKKLSQKEIAKEMSISEKTLSRWENGESQIKPEKAQQLADYFGVSVGYLLGYEDDNISEAAINFNNYVIDRMNKKAFVGFLDFISLYDIILSDKQIESIFKQLQDLSDLNGRYRYIETDKARLKSMYSVHSNYIPTKIFLEITNELYKGDSIEKQFEQYKKIID